MKVPHSATLLRESVADLRQAMTSLERASSLCAPITSGSSFTVLELDAIEVLASRFARTTDFLINRVMRALDRYELEPDGSLLDVLNRAEKRGLVKAARTLREMKELRNEIVHEYLPAGLAELLDDLRRYTPLLLATAEATAAHVERLFEPRIDASGNAAE
jgi:DNA-binding PadR family transcriptional regulator